VLTWISNRRDTFAAVGLLGSNSPTIESAAGNGTASLDEVAEHVKKRIRWYHRAAGRDRLTYMSARLFTFCAAAAIAIISITGWAPPSWSPTWLPGILGTLVALIESVQGLFRWRDQWLMFRATAAALEREYFLYVAHADSYAVSTDAPALLAIRATNLMAAEQTSWGQLHHDIAERPAGTTQ
jgi:hypothetical protein